MNAAQLKPAASPKPSRMTLASVVKGKLEQPLRVLLYGVEGIGKSTFGAGAPSPIFIGAEEGTAHLDVARFPKPESVADIYEAIHTLGTEAHEYQTAVVDTLDWLEPLFWRELCARAEVHSIEEVGGGYGKGYTAAVDEWRKFLAALERLQTVKRMHVVLLAHSQIRTFKNPEGEDFDRYQMKLHEKSAGVVKEWADAVLFAKHETLAHKDTRTKRVRGVSTGARLIYTERSAAFDAKNRYGLPPELPLAWGDFFAAARAGRVAEPSDLKAEIARKAHELGGDIEKAALEAVGRAGDNAEHLAILNNRLNAKLAERAQPAAEAKKEG